MEIEMEMKTSFLEKLSSYLVDTQNYELLAFFVTIRTRTLPPKITGLSGIWVSQLRS